MAAEVSLAARRSHGSRLYVSGLQRGRLLSATFALVGDDGYEAVTARRVSERAGVSNRTFYESFSDREDCFLAAFDYAIEGLEREVREGWESERVWTAQVRSALTALLVALDREPAVRRLVFVEALAAGPRALARRARVLESLAGILDEGRAGAKAQSKLPPLVAESVVGGAFGVIHARLLELRPEPLVGLLGSLMAMIVLPYRGSTAAARELEHPVPPVSIKHDGGDGRSLCPLGAASPVDFRLTARTHMALAAVAERSGLNNREVSEAIGLSDQGQVSRLMKRLCEQGLVENAPGDTRRLARAWQLTTDGEAVIDAHHAPSVNTSFRLTALTHEVLAQVASLGKQGPGPTNSEIASAVGVKDQGQVSKLLARLQTHGLLENTSSLTAAGNAWQLTTRGEQVLAASSPATPGAGQWFSGHTPTEGPSIPSVFQEETV